MLIKTSSRLDTPMALADVAEQAHWLLYNLSRQPHVLSTSRLHLARMYSLITLEQANRVPFEVHPNFNKIPRSMPYY
jgi:hypothetical protein